MTRKYDDATAFDALIQMRGSLRWNPILKEWVCDAEDHDTRKHGLTHSPDPNEAVAREHHAWLLRAEHSDTVVVDVGVEGKVA